MGFRFIRPKETSANSVCYYVQFLMREKTFLSPSVCLAFLRCLAHFPPADTYESRGDVKDVSCGTLEFLFKYKIYPMGVRK